MTTNDTALKLVTLLPGQIRNGRDSDDLGLPLPANDNDDKRSVKTLPSLKDLERMDQARASGYTASENGEGDSFTAFNPEAPLSNSRALFSLPTLVQLVCVPASVGASFTSNAVKAERLWKLALNSRIDRLSPIAKIFSKFPGFSRFALGTTKFVNYAGKLGNIRYVGNVLKLGGGRVIPILGAVIAGLDCTVDVVKCFTIKKDEKHGESDEAFNKRKSEQYKDTAINVGCTTAGAIIGGVIGSVIPGAGTVIGAMIGAGIGNVIGNLCKGGGLGRIGRTVFGFLTGR